jgi:EGF-like domain
MIIIKPKKKIRILIKNLLEVYGKATAKKKERKARKTFPPVSQKKAPIEMMLLSQWWGLLFVVISISVKSVDGTTPCTSNPCMNGATCSSINGGSEFNCDCASSSTGFYGCRCSLSCDPADGATAPCARGTCVTTPGPNWGTCTCPAGYEDPTCNTATFCGLSNPCKNGNTCHSITLGSGTCSDPYVYGQGYCGSLTVVKGNDNFNCNSNAWRGVYCNVTLFCPSHPGYCLNGGTCNEPDYTKTSGTATETSANAIGSCSCPFGWFGCNCNQTTPVCCDHPCQNNGTCYDLPSNTAGYWCDCPSGYTGRSCQIVDCKNGTVGWAATKGTTIMYRYDVHTHTVDSSNTITPLSDASSTSYHVSVLASHGSGYIYGSQYNPASGFNLRRFRTNMHPISPTVQHVDNTVEGTLGPCGSDSGFASTFYIFTDEKFIGNDLYSIRGSDGGTHFCLSKVTIDTVTDPTTPRISSAAQQTVFLVALQGRPVFVPHPSATTQHPLFYYFANLNIYVLDGTNSQATFFAALHGDFPGICVNNLDWLSIELIRSDVAYLSGECHGTDQSDYHNFLLAVHLPSGIVRTIVDRVTVNGVEPIYTDKLLFTLQSQFPISCDAVGGWCNQIGDGSRDGMCDCNDGFTGTACGTDINECASNPCQPVPLHGGGTTPSTCVDQLNGFVCHCGHNYITGLLCQTLIHECDITNPCLNGGTCVENDIGQFDNCTCPDGFTGSAVCAPTLVVSSSAAPSSDTSVTPASTATSTLSAAVIGGIVAGVAVAILMAAGIVWYYYNRGPYKKLPTHPVSSSSSDIEPHPYL